MKGLIAPSLLPIPIGGSSKEFTNWLFLREVSSRAGGNNRRVGWLLQAKPYRATVTGEKPCR
ncbi:hypothetical protein GR197_19655 [Rhizobium phaseoli]|uniref:Uncharacterized protein n=1 Tax=Rhizobium phaseoli TaxID=396 RepID=A0A7K3UGD3_9HYPH|nr:hypothetical protein [Rhizobium phaseoli]NEJ72726.1 hypothetical protein [Rhizobium phaseoli]